MNNKEIYVYNDEISFRFCSLYNNGGSTSYGNCTNFYVTEEKYKRYYDCYQFGVHFYCTKHPEQELVVQSNLSIRNLNCPKCNKDISIDDLEYLIKDCIRMHNISAFKNSKLIRLDDWYIPEKKEKIKLDSDYWIRAEVKTDKDRDTIIILYIGRIDSKEKAQFFIKPEKLQLSSDYKDLDPATILSKIEVTLKDRVLSQKYDDKDDIK